MKSRNKFWEGGMFSDNEIREKMLRYGFSDNENLEGLNR